MRVAITVLFVSTSAIAAPFEKTPTPPRVFDGIRPGRAVSDLKLTSWQPDAGYKDAASRTRLIRDAGAGAKYYVLVAGGVVSRIGVEVPENGLVSRLERLWGKPSRATNLANEAVASWSIGNWRVDLSCRGELCRMAFHEPLRAAFFGAHVQPPGALARLRPGMTRAELAQVSPRHLSPDVPVGPEDVRVTVDLAKTGHVRSVILVGLPRSAPGVLENAWGKPVETDDGRAWFNPDLGWRATLIESIGSLQFTGYIPASKILGAGPGIALLAKPVLGATREQIFAAYPTMTRALGSKLVIELPPSEGGSGRLVASFDTTTQRVNKITLELPYDNDLRRDELLAQMSAKWGRPTANSAVLVFPTDKVAIEVADGAKRLELVISLP